MKHLFLAAVSVIALTACAGLPARAPASAEAPNSRALALQRFREFATRTAILFGEPKGSQITFDESQDRFSLFIGTRNVGSAELFQHCAAAIPDGGELSFRCLYGVNGKVGKHDVAVDPQVNSDGYPMTTLGTIMMESHFQDLAPLVNEIPAARQALASAMAAASCRKVDFGDSAAAMMWLQQAALGDEDTGKLIPGTEHTWRGTLPCRDGKYPVYFDVTERAVSEKEAKLFITPVKVSPGTPVFVKSETPEN